ncbi:polysaccharide deacetylase family protein [Arenibacterium sp. CAU 1754]
MTVALLIIGALCLGGIAWFLLPFGLRKLETRRLERLCRDQRAIVLTYDDGPAPYVSTPLAALLRAEGVPATFFVIGRNALAEPDMVRTLKRDGHEIANHTQNHTNAWRVSPWVSNRDISAGRDTLRGLEVETSLFRPPFGKSTLAGLAHRLRHGLRYAYWTVDTRDSWDRRQIPDVLEEILQKQGGVVLMHDFEIPKRGPDPAQHLDYVLKATREIIDFARKNNMRLCRFSDLYSPPRESEPAH